VLVQVGFLRRFLKRAPAARPETPEARDELQVRGGLVDFGHLKLRRCRYGWMLFAGPMIGKCFELYGEYSEAEVEVFRAVLQPGDWAIDVGANIGDLTLPISRIVGTTGRIFAVESHPEAFNVLCANLALNQVTNVKTLNVFIADRPGIDTSGAFWGKYAYTGEVWEPTFLAIDELKLPRCNLIKVDVDGKELEVLRSARQTIAAHRPVLYFENDQRERSADLLGFILGLGGYRLYAHGAPIFKPDNFLQNPVNAWHPKNIASLMMLAIPEEAAWHPSKMPEVKDAGFWWDQWGRLRGAV
jgi:hypothetical protein